MAEAGWEKEKKTELGEGGEKGRGRWKKDTSGNPATRKLLSGRGGTSADRSLEEAQAGREKRSRKGKDKKLKEGGKRRGG